MRKPYKLLFAIVPLFLIFLSCLYAADEGGSDARLLYFPRTVVNNAGVMIELSQKKNLTKEDFDKDFNSTSEGNLSLFRLVDSLFPGDGDSDGYSESKSEYFNRRDNQYHTPTKLQLNSIGSGHYTFADGTFTTNSCIVKISTDGLFVNENNPTAKRPFTLQCFCVERTLVGESYTDGTKYEIALGQSESDITTLNGSNGSNATTYFYKNGNDYYLMIPSSPYYVISKSYPVSYYPQYLRDFDICIKLEDDRENLEPGYYSCNLSLTSTAYYEYEVIIGAIRLYPYPFSTLSLNENITVRGYIGYEPTTSVADTSFSVLPSTDTFTMNLKNSSTYYDVASMTFYSINVVNQKIEDDDIPSEPEQRSYSSWGGTRYYWSFNGSLYPDQESAYNAYETYMSTSRAGKYTIYISPTSDYTAPGTYQFIKANTETQTRTNYNTIGYKLYKTNSGDTFSTKSGLPSTTYMIRPEYDALWIGQGDDSVGTTTQSRETWIMDNQHIYLQVDSTTNQQEKGMYYSNIYITLVTNDSI